MRLRNNRTTGYKTKSSLSISLFFFISLTAVWVFFLFILRAFFVASLFFRYQSICKFWKIDKISSASFHCIWKCRKFENTDRNNSPKTFSFWRYFSLFRPSETQNVLLRPTMVANIECPPFQNLWIRSCSPLSPSLFGVDLLLSPHFTQKRSSSSYNSPHEW